MMGANHGQGSDLRESPGGAESPYSLIVRTGSRREVRWCVWRAGGRPGKFLLETRHGLHLSSARVTVPEAAWLAAAPTPKKRWNVGGWSSVRRGKKESGADETFNARVRDSGAPQEHRCSVAELGMVDVQASAKSTVSPAIADASAGDQDAPLASLVS